MSATLNRGGNAMIKGYLINSRLTGLEDGPHGNAYLLNGGKYREKIMEFYIQGNCF